MIVVVGLLGMIIAVMGIFFFLHTKALRRYIEYWKHDKRLKQGAILSFLFGIIFLVASTECKLRWFIILLGIWAIIKGVLLLTLKKEKMYAYMDWWLKSSDSRLRCLSIVIFAFGILVVYAV